MRSWVEFVVCLMFGFPGYVGLGWVCDCGFLVYYLLGACMMFCFRLVMVEFGFVV